jgi:hypothetical protein
MEKENTYNSTIITKHGLFELKVMPFGLKNVTTHSHA